MKLLTQFAMILVLGVVAAQTNPNTTVPAPTAPPASPTPRTAGFNPGQTPSQTTTTTPSQRTTTTPSQTTTTTPSQTTTTTPGQASTRAGAATSAPAATPTGTGLAPGSTAIVGVGAPINTVSGPCNGPAAGALSSPASPTPPPSANSSTTPPPNGTVGATTVVGSTNVISPDAASGLTSVAQPCRPGSGIPASGPAIGVTTPTPSPTPRPF